RVARRVVCGSRACHVNGNRLGLSIGARQNQHLVNGFSVIIPSLLELSVELVLRCIMANLLVATLGLCNRAIQLLHLLFGCSYLGWLRRQQVAAFDRPKIRGEVVEIAEYAGIRQPLLGDILRQTVEVAQPRNTEQAEDHDQQKEKQKNQSKVESDRTRLAHSGRMSGC